MLGSAASWLPCSRRFGWNVVLGWRTAPDAEPGARSVSAPTNDTAVARTSTERRRFGMVPPLLSTSEASNTRWGCAQTWGRKPIVFRPAMVDSEQANPRGRSSVSDHFDLLDAAAPDPARAPLDITDLYVFQTPGDTWRSALIMNVNPLTLGAAFDPLALYRINVDTDADAEADL